MTRQVKLLINDVPVSLDYFVQGFIDHTIAGMIGGLEDTGEIEVLSLSIEGDKVKINLNNAPLRANAFVSKIVRNTIFGMLSTLKGVGKIDKVNLTIGR
ncbi:MAG: hypothetical protein HY529_04590 [Chloroflexi bacterium]|nr:hypothetical protein [Chloroflexota bacterium]